MCSKKKIKLVNLPVDRSDLKNSPNIGAILIKNTNCKLFVKRGGENEKN